MLSSHRQICLIVLAILGYWVSIPVAYAQEPDLDLYWNVWAEKLTAPEDQPTFEPVVGSLEPNTKYRFVVDLAAVVYFGSERGVRSDSVRFISKEGVEEAERRGLASVQVEIAPRQNPGDMQIVRSASTMTIDIGKIKRWQGTAGMDWFAALKQNPQPDFQFGRAVFVAKTYTEEGFEEIVGLLLKNGPHIVEVINAMFCVVKVAKAGEAQRGCAKLRFLDIPVTSAGSSADLWWNLWAESGEGYSFKPALYLIPGMKHTLFLDLAKLAYGESVLGQPVSADLRGKLRKWLDSALPSAELQILVLPHPGSFEKPKSPVTTLTLNLQEIRVKNLRLKNTDAKDTRKALDIMKEHYKDPGRKGDPDFVFGRVAFPLKSRSDAVGPARIGLSMWVDNRPVDEFVVELCIAPDDATAKDKCPEANKVITRSNMDALLLTSDHSKPPDAALHFVELGSQDVIGVFRWKSADNKLETVTWPLNQKPDGTGGLRENLRAHVKTIAESRNDQAALQQRGWGLYNMLFPDTTDPEHVAARTQFQNYIRPFLSKQPFEQNAPTIFVRFVHHQANEPPLLLPLGLMTVEPPKESPQPTVDVPVKPYQGFLGFHTKIEQPLEQQSYDPSPKCLSRWALAIPGETDGDSDINRARAVIGERMLNWIKNIPDDERLSEFSKMNNWFLKDKLDPATAFLLLSHHGDDTVSYKKTGAPVLRAKEITRQFAKPSVAILNACGTGDPGAVGFIRELNARGMNTIVATSTTVDARMAGQFLDCFAKQVETNSDISQAYFAALKCLMSEKNETGQEHGARVLEYTLLGNGTIKLCPPKSQ